MSTSLFSQIIRELCAEQHILYTELSDGWIFRLERPTSNDKNPNNPNNHTKNPNKFHYISGNDLGLNSSSSTKLASDKVSTYSVLNFAGISAVPHHLIFNPDFITKKSLPDSTKSSISLYLDSATFPLVVKPNHGSRGRDVSLAHSKSQALSLIKKLSHSDESIALSPFFPTLSEYRCFYLDGSILLIYRKIRTSDSFHSNLSHGATTEVIPETSEIYCALQQLAIRAGTALGLRFATIDILESPTHELRVLEINPGVTTTLFIQKTPNGYELAKNIYRKALKKIF